jgi:predicted HAD superfamily Cof-like phosphohydrolase
MLEKQLREVEQFHRAVTGLPIPELPIMLTGERMDKSLEMLCEEINEFEMAATIGDQADALIDLIYFAYGRLLEMGIRPGPAFDLVHKANMEKVRGPNKRGDQFEAMKPDGWTAPDWNAFLGRQPIVSKQVQLGQYHGLVRENNPWDGASVPAKPRIILLGYGRHGKDTVAEILRDEYGYKFTSSSMVCAEKVMMPAFLRQREEWLAQTAEDHRLKGTPVPQFYASVEDCFNDRHNHRAFWFQEIEKYNYPDRSRLAQDIFEEHDIYVGLRSAKEFMAARNSGVFDIAIWVDRSDHVPPEDKASCTVEPWMADFHLDNNGTLEDLRFNLNQLVITLEDGQ